MLEQYSSPVFQLELRKLKMWLLNSRWGLLKVAQLEPSRYLLFPEVVLRMRNW